MPRRYVAHTAATPRCTSRARQPAAATLSLLSRGCRAVRKPAARMRANAVAATAQRRVRKRRALSRTFVPLSSHGKNEDTWDGEGVCVCRGEVKRQSQPCGNVKGAVQCGGGSGVCVYSGKEGVAWDVASCPRSENASVARTAVIGDTNSARSSYVRYRACAHVAIQSGTLAGSCRHHARKRLHPSAAPFMPRPPSFRPVRRAASRVLLPPGGGVMADRCVFTTPACNAGGEERAQATPPAWRLRVLQRVWSPSCSRRERRCSSEGGGVQRQQ